MSFSSENVDGVTSRCHRTESVIWHRHRSWDHYGTSWMSLGLRGHVPTTPIHVPQAECSEVVGNLGGNKDGNMARPGGWWKPFSQPWISIQGQGDWRSWMGFNRGLRSPMSFLVQRLCIWILKYLRPFLRGTGPFWRTQCCNFMSFYCNFWEMRAAESSPGILPHFALSFPPVILAFFLKNRDLVCDWKNGVLIFFSTTLSFKLSHLVNGPMICI